MQSKALINSHDLYSSIFHMKLGSKILILYSFVYNSFTFYGNSRNLLTWPLKSELKFIRTYMTYRVRERRSFTPKSEDAESTLSLSLLTRFCRQKRNGTVDEFMDGLISTSDDSDKDLELGWFKVQMEALSEKLRSKIEEVLFVIPFVVTPTHYTAIGL